MAENSSKVLVASYVRIVNMDSKTDDRVFESSVQVLCGYDPQGVNVKLIKGHGKENGFFTEKNGERTNENNAENGQEEELLDFLVTKTTPLSKKREMHVLHTEDEVLFIKFATKDYDKMFDDILSKVQNINNSVFLQRTEDSSASQYFQFYGYLSQQQNMMQDFVRTSTYQKAIHGNFSDFNGKIVLDVGAGSGILSFFAVQAGAAKVYAVEASNMAQYAQQLVDANGLSDRIEVIAGKIEEIELPQKVDIIVSEPMGYMLYNERMLETYLHAKKWLKPNGKMFPSRGDLHVAPFCDEALYMEQYNKANFWYQTSFHNVDLSSLRQAAMKEYFRQPIVDSFDIRICLAKSVRHVVDFLEADEFDLHNINIPLEFEMLETGTVHGLAFWFDVEFIGSTSQVWLSTSPTEPLTHWYQVRCLLQNPIFVKQGQVLTGHVILVANKRQSYDVTMDVKLEGTQISSFNTLDLKNPYFRYTGGPISAPPGSTTQSPSEVYWQQLDTSGTRSAVNLLNGLGEVAIDQQQLLTSNLMTIGNQAQHLIQQLPPTQPNLYHNINPNIHTGSISSTGRNSNYPSSQFHHPGVAEAPGSSKMVDDTRMLIEQSNRLGKVEGQVYDPSKQGNVTSTYSIDQPMLSAMQQMFSIHQQYPPANVKHFPSTAPPTAPQLYFN